MQVAMNVRESSVAKFSSSRHSVSPKLPEWYSVTMFETFCPKTFSTTNSTCELFWKVIVIGISL